MSFVAATGELETDFEALALYSIEVSKEAIRNTLSFTQSGLVVPASFNFKINEGRLLIYLVNSQLRVEFIVR